MSETPDSSAPMEHVNIRIPSELRKRAKEMAAVESTEIVEVREGHIYRRAIEFFLLAMDSKTLQNGQ